MMASPDDLWEELFGKLIALRGRWPAQAWTYDRRFRCVSSSLPQAEEAAAVAAGADILTSSWTVATLGGAPLPVRVHADSCGGLREGQKISWGGGLGAPGVFGLWWPWGDGVTLSVRIGLHDLDEPKRRYPRLREVFGIAGPPTAD
jgi:hypothetical protein